MKPRENSAVLRCPKKKAAENCKKPIQKKTLNKVFTIYLEKDLPDCLPNLELIAGFFINC